MNNLSFCDLLYEKNYTFLLEGWAIHYIASIIVLILAAFRNTFSFPLFLGSILLSGSLRTHFLDFFIARVLGS